MSRRAKITITLLALLGLAYLAGGWYFSGQIVAFKTKSHAEDLEKLGFSGPADYGLPAPEEIVVTGYQDVRLTGFYFKNERPPREASPPCGVIIQHGFTGTRWGAVKYAPLFWKRGCDLVMMDARYHGTSGGEYGTLGYFERYDMQRVLAWFSAKTGLPKRKIGLMGVSMGGAISLLTAALEPEIAFVAADASYHDLGTILAERARILYHPALQILVPIAFVIAELRADIEIEDVSPGSHAGEIKAPVFLSRSDTDAYTPPYHSEVIFEHLAHDRRVLHKTDWGSKHGKCIDDNFARYEANVDAFMKEYVPDFGK